MNSLETVKWLLCSANFCQSEAAWRIFQAQEITRASIPDHFAKTNFIKFIRNSSKIYPIQTFQIFPSCPLLSCIVWLFGLIAAASAGDRALVHNPRAVYEGLATWQTVYSRIWWNAQWLQNNCGGSVLWRGSLNVCNLEILRDLTHRRQNSAGLWRPGIEPRVRPCWPCRGGKARCTLAVHRCVVYLQWWNFGINLDQWWWNMVNVGWVVRFKMVQTSSTIWNTRLLAHKTW